MSAILSAARHSTYYGRLCDSPSAISGLRLFMFLSPATGRGEERGQRTSPVTPHLTSPSSGGEKEEKQGAGAQIAKNAENPGEVRI